MVNKFGKSPEKLLKTSLLEFYDVASISGARKQLLKDAKSLETFADFPHIPERRDGVGRATREVDDLFTILNYPDGNKILSRLAKYVADGADCKPWMRLYEGDLCVIMTLLSRLGV